MGTVSEKLELLRLVQSDGVKYQKNLANRAKSMKIVTEVLWTNTIDLSRSPRKNVHFPGSMMSFPGFS